MLELWTRLISFYWSTSKAYTWSANWANLLEYLDWVASRTATKISHCFICSKFMSDVISKVFRTHWKPRFIIKPNSFVVFGEEVVSIDEVLKQWLGKILFPHFLFGLILEWLIKIMLTFDFMLLEHDKHTHSTLSSHNFNLFLLIFFLNLFKHY